MSHRRQRHAIREQLLLVQCALCSDPRNECEPASGARTALCFCEEKTWVISGHKMYHYFVFLKNRKMSSIDSMIGMPLIWKPPCDGPVNGHPRRVAPTSVPPRPPPTIYSCSLFPLERPWRQRTPNIWQNVKWYLETANVEIISERFYGFDNLLILLLQLSSICDNNWNNMAECFA